MLASQPGSEYWPKIRSQPANPWIFAVPRHDFVQNCRILVALQLNLGLQRELKKFLTVRHGDSGEPTLEV
jgi:hypothetical protein